MAILTEGLHRAEFLLSEGDDPIIYEEVTFAAVASTPLKPGTVVGIVTASGNYKAYASGASDGSQNAVGVTLDWVPVNASTQKGVIVTRLAEVNGSLLTGLDATSKAALAARNVIAR